MLSVLLSMGGRSECIFLWCKSRGGEAARLGSAADEDRVEKGERDAVSLVVERAVITFAPSWLSTPLYADSDPLFLLVPK